MGGIGISRRPAVLAAVVLALVASVILHGIGRGEFDPTYDEAAHAITGVFFRDFFRDLPLLNAQQYAFRYYAQYPALGLIHWPPLFHVAEGLVFTLFGPSVVAARLTVALFCMLGAVFWYRLVSRLHSPGLAALSTIVLATLPEILRCEKSVILEMPSLALCIVASYYWVVYLETGVVGNAYRFAATAGLALLTKQHSVYLAFFCLLTLVLLNGWKLMRPRRVAGAVALGLVLVVPYYALTMRLHRHTIAADVLQGGAHPGRFTFYWTALPQAGGWVVLCLAVAGLVSWRGWADSRAFRVMIAWVAASYLMLLAFAQTEARYSIYWLPAIAFFASGVFFIRTTVPPIRVVLAAAGMLLAGANLWGAWQFRKPATNGYLEAAKALVSRGPGGVVLYDGAASHDFIFFVRLLDRDRKWYVLRKNLYVARINWDYGRKVLAHSEADLRELIADYGVRYFAVQDPNHEYAPIQKTLREYLAGPNFKLIQRVAIGGDIPGDQDVGVLLYLNPNWSKPRKTTLTVPMMTLDHDIEVPLN